MSVLYTPFEYALAPKIPAATMHRFRACFAQAWPLLPLEDEVENKAGNS